MPEWSRFLLPAKMELNNEATERVRKWKVLIKQRKAEIKSFERRLAFYSQNICANKDS